LALIEVGQRSRAEQELSAVASGGPDLARGAIAVSSDAGMTELAVRLDTKLFPDGGGLDLAAYPVPPWQPQSGFTVDRALIYAVIRQESRFNPQAKSSAGARGLMQLMPSTATYVAHNNGYTVRKRSALHEPTINLTLGQRYMEMLLGDANVDGDLFRLATAWNGGPGNLQKWRARIDDRGDPLLFIETIPAGETRNFIERVLANLWIYRDRLGQPSPSLDALAAGGWPAYQPLDRKPLQVASYGEN
jgi:soluble lytic murein transglycosylase-like protein